MNNFERQTHPTSWIGYAKAPSKPTPVRLADDAAAAPMAVRPDVYVREFTSVLVKGLKVSDRESRGTRSVSVTFDGPSSETGSDKRLSHDFSASTQAGTQVHEALQWAADQGKPVYVAIETKRRYKNASGEVIPYTTPMHVLRGSQPDGTKANSSATRDNCANVIAVVGPADDPARNILSAELTTDIAEWEHLRHNRDGSLPPAGWRRVFTDDGQPAGAIVADTGAAGPSPQTEAPTVDAQQLAREIVAAMVPQQSSQQAPKLGQRPPMQTARAAEAKAWEPWNSDGRINPSSYVVQSVRWTRKDALDLVNTALAVADDADTTALTVQTITTEVNELVRPLMWAARQVQQSAVGYSRETEASYREAAKWVSQVCQYEYPYSVDLLGDKEARSGWIKQVAATAAELYSMALGVAASLLDADQPASTPQPQPAQPPEARRETAPETAQSAPKPTMSQVPELIQRWDALIEKVGMAKFVDHLNPLLTATFGTHLSDQIPADTFAHHLQQWEADPHQFFEAGKTAAQATAA